MMQSPLVLLGLLIILAMGSLVNAQPTHVTIEQTETNGWRLLVDGEPYRIKGAGGNHSMAELVAAGGNTTRTWGVHDETGDVLDEAHRNGLKVVVGIWLGHPRHGFDYSDIEQVAAQYQHVRRSVEKHKDHPALLMWGLGNEMEHGDGESNAAVWSHLEACAALIKDLDPHHPVMTVFAEINQEKLAAVHQLCPSIDVIGSNSYGGAASFPVRYRDAGGMLPYVIAEFGPLGTWEVPKDEHGMVLEQTSTEKAEFYEEVYLALEADTEMCLGSFAFLWSHKQEATHTWFGMWLPDGNKVGSVDAMTRLWSGRPPANLCPTIEPIEALDGTSGLPGTVLRFTVAASDPEGATLQAKWLFKAESDRYITGGDAQAVPERLDSALIEADAQHAVVRLPDQPGNYRLHVAVYDGQGAAATANVPLRVFER
ncbi:MAG: glycoside hydrolase family 2 TIM barrel-domain containing protein [Phycisphaeraceae bacterium]